MFVRQSIHLERIMGVMMTRVVIADDQVLLRKSIGHIISIDEDIQVVATVGNGKEAIEACKVHKPDIVLMDIEMPVMDGVAATAIIKKKYPETKVIILTTFDNSDNIVEAFMAKADGYVVKDIGWEELVATIKCVLFGLTVIHESVRQIMLEKFSKIAKKKKGYEDLLTSEEIDIIRLIVEGESNKHIGQLLSYSEGTVKNKVSRIYEKLELKDRLQLTLYAVEHGIA